jgi:hypothetical protein
MGKIIPLRKRETFHDLGNDSSDLYDRIQDLKRKGIEFTRIDSSDGEESTLIWKEFKVG